MFDRSRSALLPFALLAASAVLVGCGPPAGERGVITWLSEVESRAVGEEAWQSGLFHRIPGDVPRVEVRAAFRLDEGAAAPPLGLRLQALATCEVRWDGVDLQAAGRLGRSRGEERPAPLHQVLFVPAHLAAVGEHLVELDCSAFHRGFEPTAGFWTLQVGPYERLLRSDREGLVFALVSFSGMVLVGLFALATWLLDRRRRVADLWLSFFCLAAAGLAVAESWRRLVDYTYDWHLLRLRLVTALAWLVTVTLVTYVVRRFPRRGGHGWILAVALGCAASAWVFKPWDAKSSVMFLLALPVAALWCLRAVRAGRRNAWAALVGVGLCLGILLWQPLLFVDRNLYVAVDVLLLCLLIGHAREVQDTRREKESAMLAAARLESELLRRQLQPHFLMNTLTALAEWIEEDPPTAVRLIDALAEEMRTLRAVSTRRAVTLAEELALCRSHLEVMSLRRDVRYELEVEDVDESRRVPPAVLHTLVENAVTHGAPPAAGDIVRLALRQEDRPGGRLLVFDAPLGEAAGASHPGDVAPRRGTGLGYVEARLRETYGEGWRFESGQEDGAWRSRIFLPDEERTP